MSVALGEVCLEAVVEVEFQGVAEDNKKRSLGGRQQSNEKLDCFWGAVLDANAISLEENALCVSSHKVDWIVSFTSLQRHRRKR